MGKRRGPSKGYYSGPFKVKWTYVDVPDKRDEAELWRIVVEALARIQEQDKKSTP
jgi:hypothetical protein